MLLKTFIITLHLTATHVDVEDDGMVNILFETMRTNDKTYVAFSASGDLPKEQSLFKPARSYGVRAELECDEIKERNDSPFRICNANWISVDGMIFHSRFKDGKEGQVLSPPKRIQNDQLGRSKTENLTNSDSTPGLKSQ